MNIFPRLLLSVALFVPALSLLYMPLRRSCLPHMVMLRQPTERLVHRASICLAKRSTPAVGRR